MTKITPWLLLLVLLGGLYWQHHRHEQRRAKIEGLEREVAVLEDSISARGERIALLGDSVAKYQAEADTAAARAGREVTEARGDAAVARAALEEALADDPEATAALADLLAAHRREVAALMTRVNTLVALSSSQSVLITEQTDQLADYSGANGRLHELVAYWEAEAHRGWWENPLITVPAAVGGTLVLVTALGAVIP